MRERIELAWQGLFYPVPEGCAQEVVHAWIHDQRREEALKTFNSSSFW